MLSWLLATSGLSATAIHVMKKPLLLALTSLTIVAPPLHGTQSLSFSGPTVWNPGQSIVLSTQDTYSGFAGGSWGLTYWVQVNTAIASFLTITDVAHFTFTDAHLPLLVFPLSFDSTSGADTGFLTTTAADGHTGDLGGSSSAPIPDGSYHVTDITFALAANAPAGTYTLRTTTANPRGSIQVTSDFNDAPFPQASFVFTIVPEPSTLALSGIGAASSGVLIYRRRKNRGGATGKSTGGVCSQKQRTGLVYCSMRLSKKAAPTNVMRAPAKSTMRST